MPLASIQTIDREELRRELARGQIKLVGDGPTVRLCRHF
jgi:hypothetical protein